MRANPSFKPRQLAWLAGTKRDLMALPEQVIDIV
jgi:hypothetical protein